MNNDEARISIGTAMALALGYIAQASLFHKSARSYYKVSQSFLVDLFFIGFILEGAGVERKRSWDPIPSAILFTRPCRNMFEAGWGTDPA